MKKFLKHFRYGEKGFTLIELLVVIAILGVLAAVVVPNVSRFMGKGKAESGLTELHNVQTAVTAMMVDLGVTTLSSTDNVTTSPENDMDDFPTSATYVLFDSTGTRYLQKQETQYWYNCDSYGTVRGWWESTGSTSGGEIGIDAPP